MEVAVSDSDVHHVTMVTMTTRPSVSYCQAENKGKRKGRRARLYAVSGTEEALLFLLHVHGMKKG
jgi:hypothetical protein